MDVPDDLVALMAFQRGHVNRADRPATIAELSRLGIEADSQLGSFLLSYQLSPVSSVASREELMDPVSPSPQMRSVAEFVRESYSVPAGYVCLTSAEGEGFYLYELASGAIYDVNAVQVPLLAGNGLRPRWSDAFTFLRWYLGWPEVTKRPRTRRRTTRCR